MNSIKPDEIRAFLVGSALVDSHEVSIEFQSAEKWRLEVLSNQTFGGTVQIERDESAERSLRALAETKFVLESGDRSQPSKGWASVREHLDACRQTIMLHFDRQKMSSSIVS